MMIILIKMIMKIYYAQMRLLKSIIHIKVFFKIFLNFILHANTVQKNLKMLGLVQAVGDVVLFGVIKRINFYNNQFVLNAIMLNYLIGKRFKRVLFASHLGKYQCTYLVFFSIKFFNSRQLPRNFFQELVRDGMRIGRF